MGTDKRARQKANRAAKQQRVAQTERAAATKRGVVKWGGIAAAFIVMTIVLALLTNRSGDDTTASSTTETPATTVAAETPAKPTVNTPADTPTELVTTVLTEGEGDGAVAGNTVVVHYVGVRSEDGTEFDNSYDRGTPFPVKLGTGAVIKGWDQGLIGAKKGSRIQLDIPAELAYGDQERGIIQPGDALTFVIDVISIDKDS